MGSYKILLKLERVVKERDKERKKKQVEQIEISYKYGT